MEEGRDGPDVALLTNQVPIMIFIWLDKADPYQPFYVEKLISGDRNQIMTSSKPVSERTELSDSSVHQQARLSAHPALHRLNTK